MTVKELTELIDGKVLTQNSNLEKEVKGGYSCDLLSWVMAHATAGTAWMTIQTHMNVVAVGSLLELACIVCPESVDVAKDTIAKAEEEDVVIISSPKTAFEISGILYADGIKAAKK